MRKFLLLLIAVISLLLAGCGSSSTQEDFANRVGQAMREPPNDPTTASSLGSLRRVAMSAETTDTTSITPDQLFDWAEANFFQVFYRRESSLTWANYRFRYYWMTDTYLSVDDKNNLFALGNVTNNQIISLGNISEFSTTVKTWLNRDRPFALDYTKTLDLVPYYDEICPQPDQLARGNFKGRHVQNVIPADLNKDGKIDLVLNLWCNPVTNWGIPYSGTTPSRLLVLRQVSNGLFIEDTSSFFGSKLVSTGGIEDNYLTHDFNNDGYLDIVLPLGREDGRRMIDEPGQGLQTFSLAVMSNGNGTYRLDNIGYPQWGLKITKLVNTSDQVEFIISSENTKLWQYINGSFQSLNRFYGWVTNGTLFLKPKTRGKGSETAFQAGNGSLVGVLVREKDASGEWVGKGSWGWESKPLKYTLGSQGGVVTDGIYINLDGKDYLNPSLTMSCELNRTPSSPAEVVYLFSGSEIKGGYKGQIVEDPYPTELSFLVSFVVDEYSNPQRTNLIIKNEVREKSFANRIECRDVNGDGYQDIILYSSTNSEPERKFRTPIVYLNDRKGSFGLVDRTIFPVSPWFGGRVDAGQSNYIFEDLDGDGIPELIYFPINGGVGEAINLFIHKGLRNITQNDVLQ